MSLTDLCSDLFLFLVTFRRQVRKGVNPEMNVTRARLLELFEDMDRRGGEDANLARLYEKVKYVLVILADEIMINCNWTYSAAWEEEILEWEMFQSAVAGEEFFARLESEGEKDESLAEIYYMALCLGFVGQYSDNPTKIFDLKRRLYRMLPGRFSDKDKLITPDAYYVGEGTDDPYKPMINLGRIGVICLAAFVGLIVFYQGFKSQVGEEVEEHLRDMKRAVAPTEVDLAALNASIEEDIEAGGGKFSWFKPWTWMGGDDEDAESDEQADDENEDGEDLEDNPDAKEDDTVADDEDRDDGRSRSRANSRKADASDDGDGEDAKEKGGATWWKPWTWFGGGGDDDADEDGGKPETVDERGERTRSRSRSVSDDRDDGDSSRSRSRSSRTRERAETDAEEADPSEDDEENEDEVEAEEADDEAEPRVRSRSRSRRD